MAISCHQILPPDFYSQTTLQNSLATTLAYSQTTLLKLSFSTFYAHSTLGSAYDTPQGRPRYRPRMVPLWRLSCTIFSCQFSTRIFPARFSTKIFQKYFREKVNKFSKRFSKTFAVEDANDLPARGTLTYSSTVRRCLARSTGRSAEPTLLVHEQHP